MDKSRFPSVTIEKLGTYRLIAEQELDEMLIYSELVKKTDAGIGFLIRYYRKKAKLSQSKLGDLVGVAQKHIDSIEQNKIKSPSSELLEKIAECLGPEFKNLYEHLALIRS